MRPLSARDKLVLAGLYLSKFDKQGLEMLGFDSFTEAFNTIALSLKGRPASLKNYRDEFDPFFPNPRQGWHKRPLREYCKAILNSYGQLGLQEFTALLKPLISGLPILEDVEKEMPLYEVNEESSFAKRLITGVAAESYFERVFPQLEAFRGCKVTNATQIGCGFDFKVDPPDKSPFLAVEVKGLRAPSGTVALTEKEQRMADRLQQRYFLFVARNFAEQPFHSLYQNPLHCGLNLARIERTIVTVNWNITIPL